MIARILNALHISPPKATDAPVRSRASELPPLPPRPRPTLHELPPPAGRPLADLKCSDATAGLRQNAAVVADRLARPQDFYGSATGQELADLVDELAATANLVEVSPQSAELSASLVPVLEKTFFARRGAPLIERLTNAQLSQTRDAFVTMGFERGISEIDKMRATAKEAQLDLGRLAAKSLQNAALRKKAAAQLPKSQVKDSPASIDKEKEKEKEKEERVKKAQQDIAVALARFLQ